MKSKKERVLWKSLHHFTKQVKIELDYRNLNEMSSVKSYYVQDVQIRIHYENMVGKEWR